MIRIKMKEIEIGNVNIYILNKLCTYESYTNNIIFLFNNTFFIVYLLYLLFFIVIILQFKNLMKN